MTWMAFILFLVILNWGQIRKDWAKALEHDAEVRHGYHLD